MKKKVKLIFFAFLTSHRRKIPKKGKKVAVLTICSPQITIKGR